MRGYEATAVMAAVELTRTIDPASLAGSLVVVPVLRLGGRFSPGGRPGVAWRFPGDAGGERAARDAFVLFSEIAVGSAVVIVLGSPPPGRRGVLCVARRPGRPADAAAGAGDRRAGGAADAGDRPARWPRRRPPPG